MYIFAPLVCLMCFFCCLGWCFYHEMLTLAQYMLLLCVRLSVHMSQMVLYQNHCMRRAGFGMEAFFHLFHTELQGNLAISEKITILTFATLSQTLDLVRKFRRSKSVALSTKLAVDNTYTTVDESWLFTTHIGF